MAEISKPKLYTSGKSARQEELEDLYQKTNPNLEDSDEAYAEEPEEAKVGISELVRRRKLPLGRLKSQPDKVALHPLPPMSDEETYNVWGFLSEMGSGKSTLVRSHIYYYHHIDDCLQFIFDPMRLEYATLAVAKNTAKKRQHLLNDLIYDDEDGEYFKAEVEPDKLPVRHVIPRFAMFQREWNYEEKRYELKVDRNSMNIVKRDGGVIFAEDAAYLSPEQIFFALNYADLKGSKTVKMYLKTAVNVCRQRYGTDWFIQDLIEILKSNVKNYFDSTTKKEYDQISSGDDKSKLSKDEMDLIERLESYDEVGFFVRDQKEREMYNHDLRKIIKKKRDDNTPNKIFNFSFLAFRRGEELGKNAIVGQTELILQRLNTIAAEFSEAKRNEENGIELTNWQKFLLKRWRVCLWFEESEIFAPRDIIEKTVTKYPTARLMEDFMSVGRKMGFKCFGFITQRTAKLAAFIFSQVNCAWLGSITGEERDNLLQNLALNKEKFGMAKVNNQDVSMRDIISTLDKNKHEWVFIDKNKGRIRVVRTFDSPCG